jgi:hypothetical protein
VTPAPSTPYRHRWQSAREGITRRSRRGATSLSNLAEERSEIPSHLINTVVLRPPAQVEAGSMHEHAHGLRKLDGRTLNRGGDAP